jgi:hypothetical protein
MNNSKNAEVINIIVEVKLFTNMKVIKAKIGGKPVVEKV